MKTTKILMITLMAYSFQSCKKSDATNTNATVIKDCTGTYLRIDQRDYLVCNKEKLAAIAEGTKVEAVYSKLDHCEQNDVICMMAHENYDPIQVHSIR